MSGRVFCLLAVGLVQLAMTGEAATLHFAGSSQLDDGGRKVEHYPYWSWGTELEKYMPAEHRVRNCAVGGRSTKSFRAEGRWQKLLDGVRPGDFVGIQFGANDQKCATPFDREKRWADPNGLFVEILREWVGQVRAKGATPILISHSGRCTFDTTGKRIVEWESAPGVTLGTYTESTRRLAQELDCDFVDMQNLVRATSEALGRDEALKNYVISTGLVLGKDGEPTKDTTHPIKTGAELQARLFLDEVRRQGLSVTKLFARPDFSPNNGFPRAFASATQAGGGRIVVPRGIWQADVIRLASHCDLQLDEGALLACAGVEAVGLTNVTISGKGLLRVTAGGSVVFRDCQGVRLRDFTLEGAGAVPLQVLGSTDVSLRQLTVTARKVDSLSLDGSCDVTVEKCRFSAYDVEKLRRAAKYALIRDLEKISASGRVTTDLSGSGWTFDGAPVSVPHTWNATDGADGRGQNNEDSASAVSYARRRGTYRRALPDVRPGRRTFIRCLGASQRATVRVNGHEIGRHAGAYTAFCFEATERMKPTDNVLEIDVDNFVDGTLQPLQADYTVFGGLYRRVELVETDRICIDSVTDGADGVRLDVNADTGDVMAFVSVDGGTNEVRRFAFPDRELWSPEHPKLYTVDITVEQEDCSDSVRKTFGFRKAEFRPDGFYLNGVKRKIRGVNLHQDMDGCGWAVSEARHAKDIALMKEMGADGLRTAHYPHASATYDECDRQGLLVWCEYPNVNNQGVSESFRRQSLAGIREMIAQLRHHPSIVTWSVANEFRTNAVVSHAWLKRTLGDYVAEARRLDPSRPVAGATCRAYLTDINALPDVLGFNFYPGWYRREATEMTATIDAALAETPRQTIGVTEYGAGGDVDCHERPDVRNAPLSPFHSEEYQAWAHHGNYRTLRTDDRIWGAFVWVMFDFGADSRREGSRFGLNDKGLVAYDHETRKDAFWFYKANWNPEPMLHLVGERMKTTTNELMTVVAFYNGAGAVSLKVNGVDLGAVVPDDVKTAIWRNVRLLPTTNNIEVAAGGLVRKACWGFCPPAEPKDVPALMPTGTTRETWESVRRPEIVREAFESEYGVRPVERPADLAFAETAPTETCFGGAAVRKRVRATFSGPHGRAQMDFSVWIPTGCRKAPVFIHSSPRPAETAADPNGPRPVYLLPAETIVRRGYAVIAYCNQDVCYDAWEGPEFHDKGVFHAFGPAHLDARKPREWGILSAWAWGISRIVDWVETEPLLDAKRIGVVGLSRNGKTAIVAGASDPRIALTVSCCSGRGGANLVHIDQPLAESVRAIAPHGRWFAREYFDWTDREVEMPYDQHQILALIAPRLLYVSSAADDAWAGPAGEFHAARLASPAWELYGLRGLVSDGVPPATNRALQEGCVGYHRRSGPHAILASDWSRYLDFADRHWMENKGK